MEKMRSKCVLCLMLVFPFIFGEVSANPADKVVKDNQDQEITEKDEAQNRYDVYLGAFAPYSTIGSDFDGKRVESAGDYKLIMPKLDGKMGWGGTIGLRMSPSKGWTSSVEMSYYRAAHDYTWMDTTGVANMDALSAEINAFYPHFPIQPLLFVGGSLVGIKIKNGAEDNQSNVTDAEHFGVDLRFGIGFNLKVNDNLWVSNRIGYRRYWFPTVNVNDDNHNFDETRKSNGLWLTVGLYAGIRVK